MTTGTRLPDWLKDALKSHETPTVREDEWPRKPVLGEIRVALPMDLDSRAAQLVLVCSTDDKHGFASVCLVTNEVELASDQDVLLEPEETGLAYEVIAETDVAGPVWFAQLGPRLGVLEDSDFARAVISLDADSDAIPFMRRGIPIRSREDGRWMWKEREVAALHRLASECASTLVEAPADALLVVDPEVGHSTPELDKAWQAMEELLLITREIPRQSASVPIECLALLYRGISDALEQWPEGLGVDAINALATLHRTDAALGEVDENLRPVWHPGRSGSDEGNTELAKLLGAALRRGRRSLGLLTSRRVWTSPVEEAHSIAVDFLEGRVQLMPKLLDFSEV